MTTAKTLYTSLEYSYGQAMRVQHAAKENGFISNANSTSFLSESKQQKRSHVDMVTNESSVFSRNGVKSYNVKLFTITKMSSESFSYISTNNHHSTFHEFKVLSEVTGGDGENRRFIEHFTKSSGAKVEQQIVVVMREKPEEVTQQMQELESSTKELDNADIFSISDLLKYPSDYAPKTKVSKTKVKEGDIQLEKNKFNKMELTVSAEEDEEEESDDEYDEFEEEIVIVDVRRKPFWRKGLEIPKPPPEKVGIPIEDLLEIPTLNTTQESCPDEFLIDEKVDYVENPPVLNAEFPSLSAWESF